MSLSVLGAVRAAELRSSSMASILSNRTDSGCVTRSAPFSASRTASRFWFCQPFSDLLGPLLTFDCSQQTRDFLGVPTWRVGSGDRRYSAVAPQPPGSRPGGPYRWVVTVVSLFLVGMVFGSWLRVARL